MNPKLNINMFSPGLLLLRGNIFISFLLSSILIGFTISLTFLLGFTVFGQEGWAALTTSPTETYPKVIDNTGPSSPSLLAPLDRTFINVTSPFFDWTDAEDPDGIARYTLEISMASILSGGVGSSFTYPISTINIDDSPLESAFELINSLIIYDGGGYYWHVRAVDGLGNIGPYSQTFFFRVDTVVPGALTPVNPTNAAVISDNTPTFQWDRTEFTLVTSYELLIDTESTFSSPMTISITQSQSVPPRVFTPSSPLADGVYFWKVRAIDAAKNTGPYSSIRSFTIDTVPPTVTASPATGTFATNQSIRLSSTATDLDAIYYTTDGSIPDNTGTKYTGPISISSTTTVKFIGYDTLGNAGSVGTETYTIEIDNTGPTAPSLLAPSSNLYTNDTSPFFDWSDVTDLNGIARYTLEISRSKTLSGGVGSSFAYPLDVIDINGSPPASEFEGVSLSLPHGPVHWHVRAVDGLGNMGPYSQTFLFWVDAFISHAPNLVNPANAAIIGDNTPTFQWNWVQDFVASYELLLDTEDTFSSPTKISITSDRPIGGVPTEFTPTSALADGEYFWKVRAKDVAGNTGPYSSIHSFTIDTAPPTVTASPATGTFATNQSISLSSSATDLDAIYYTTDGSTPDNTDTKYTDPISISSTTTLKFIGYDTLGNAGSVGTETYTIKVTPAEIDTSLTLELSISVNIAGGSKYTASGKLTDSVTNRPISGKTITMTTDGSSPVTTTTNIKGMFTAQLTAPAKAGLHSIKAQFAGDSIQIL